MEFRFDVMLYSHLDLEKIQMWVISNVHAGHILPPFCRFPILDLVTASFTIYILLL